MKTNNKIVAATLLSLLMAPAAFAQNVGIGTDTPLSKLHVDQTTSGTRGLRVDKTGQEDGAIIDLTNTAGGFGNALEIFYNSNTIGSSAIWMRTWGGFGGFNLDNYGNAFGMQVWNRLTTNTNASIQATQDGLGHGISIQTTNAANTTAALYSYQEGTGYSGNFYSLAGPGITAYGGSGMAAYGYSDDNYGLYGYTNDSGTGTYSGTYGRSTTFSGVTGSTGAGSTYGVFSFGDFGGTGAKYFVIDHPTEPETKILKHFCVESDEPMLMYRGTVVFDATGKATVTLPEYVAAVNTDYTYDLTSIGQFQQVFIESEVDGNGVFTIAGGAPNGKVSWVVYGMRNDAYMQSNPQLLEVEIAKPASMVGKYLDPESHGMPVELGVDYQQTPTGTDSEGRPAPTPQTKYDEQEGQ